MLKRGTSISLLTKKLLSPSLGEWDEEIYVTEERLVPSPSLRLADDYPFRVLVLSKTLQGEPAVRGQSGSLPALSLPHYRPRS